ncbi:LADA_0F02036g1_1 [Lachancea dasiensis]|uniref:LADA_0F02036g1_1 n=1 Tax=Lachancea dasiensis TaxID=1072105 RepID=A0A1G4JI69_9SACH|nr:LADA_0F02036g1_1 [Lachancea dasiensis]
MTSMRNQWYNNADLLNLESTEAADVDFTGNLNTVLDPGFEAKNYDNLNSTLADTDLGKHFSSNYEDIDEFLTQELKDLDIPMIPQNFTSQTEIGYHAGYDAVWNRENERAADTPRKSHKRGPSGTAIFGFANHNKQLSLSKIGSEDFVPDGSCYADQSSSDDPRQLEKDYNSHGSSLNTLILKQQEELRLALERQQHMNSQLEKQLRSSQQQQQQLQMALEEQAIAAKHISLSRSPMKTPSSRTSQPDEKNIIVTSNSKNGVYKFPPPPEIRDQNGVISPVSGTSVNGSPCRKSQQNSKSRLLHLNGHTSYSDSGDDYSSPENIFGLVNNKPQISTDTVERMSKYFEKMNGQRINGQDRTNAKNPITPQQQIVIGPGISASSSPRAVGRHAAKESIASSASTIPQLHEEDDRNNIGQGPHGAVGLGIQMNPKSQSKFSLNKPPPLDLLPTIPGSSDNTPMNKMFSTGMDRSAFPQKHVFQHTPVKNSVNPSAMGQSQRRSPPSRPIFKSLKEDLKPPTDELDQYEGDDYEDEEPESEFNVAQSLSPILKSQGRFEGSSPCISHANSDENKYPYNLADHDQVEREHDLQHLNLSKITKKPTTLPPGEIDRYVLELSDKTFKCLFPNCGKTFRRRYNIRSHIQTHLEDRPYICDYEGCNKAFVRNHDLIRHKKIHAEKSFICPCGKKFVREDALIVHRSRMICEGGKKFNNVVIKKSPRRRGRPRKDGTFSGASSPVKESIAHGDGLVAMQMEEQLRKELIKNGLLATSYSVDNFNRASDEVYTGR